LQGIEKCGLGERIAELLVSRFGGSTRGLALSLAVGEAMLAPAMPSTTARAAGALQGGGGVGTRECAERAGAAVAAAAPEAWRC
jgi:di/tricarboxylate transporter